ncbi:MAG: hypothetical protein ACI93T_002255, partial [Porticoccaceae bacterium]
EASKTLDITQFATGRSEVPSTKLTILESVR